MGIKQFGLIGYPLGHSFSKGYFERKFGREDIADAVYQNFEIDDIGQFPRLLKQNQALVGLNVTIPYKERILPYLTEISEAADAIGAVNTLLIAGDSIKGFNTDYIGFRDSLKPLLKSQHRQALILGTGGSSKAVAYALGQLGIAYRFVSRQRDEVGFSYERLNKEIIESHLLIVNTTPLGMHPRVGEAPAIPYQYLTTEHLLYDLIYNPAETLFLQNGKAQGAAIKNGLEMLERQAEASWEIWNKKPTE